MRLSVFSIREFLIKNKKLRVEGYILRSILSIWYLKHLRYTLTLLNIFIFYLITIKKSANNSAKGDLVELLVCVLGITI